MTVKLYRNTISLSCRINGKDKKIPAESLCRVSAKGKVVVVEMTTKRKGKDVTTKKEQVTNLEFHGGRVRNFFYDASEDSA